MNAIRALRILRNILRMRTGLDPVHGVNLSSDLRRLVPAFVPGIVFDVGANRGQSAREFLAGFPGAHIYCFEPVRRTYLELINNTRSMPLVECHNIALGSARQTAVMASVRKSELSRIIAPDQEATLEKGAAIERVQMDTIAGFCKDHQLARISLLKVDTEGHDMEVLHGAEPLVAESLIDIIQVEAGLGRTSSTHIPLEQFRDLLEPYSYHLFGFYDQTHEWPTMKPNLRRANAVFISGRLTDVTTTA